MALQPILDLSFTAADGATSVTDASPTGNVMGFYGGAQVDVIATGDARLQLVNGAFCYTVDKPALDLGNRDFEIRMRVRPSAVPGNMALLSQFNGTNGNDCIELSHKAGAGLRLLIRRGGAPLVDLAQSGAPMAANTDYDVVVKRVGSAITVSRNSIIVLTGTINGTMPHPTSPIYLGYGYYSYNQSLYTQGWLDDVKILKDDTAPVIAAPASGWQPVEVVVSNHAPLGVAPNGVDPNYFLFMNSNLPETYALYPPTTYPAWGIWTPQSWNTLNVKQLCGIPADDEVVAVKVGGLIGITMGYTEETADLHLHFRKPGSGNNNYVFQTDAVKAGQGDRDNAGPCTVAVVNDTIEFAWWTGTPIGDHPIHAAYFFNLNLIEYYRKPKT
jgi:hypothetical protein